MRILDSEVRSLSENNRSLEFARRNDMGSLRRVLLFLAVGSVSVVLGACYGTMGTFRDRDLFSPPPPGPDTMEPVSYLETTRAPVPESSRKGPT